jgi:tetratricopeptide (TPR) repeat protein
MADLLFTQGDAESALRSALAALSLRPTMTQARAVAAVSLEALGEYSRALSQVEQGLQLVAALGGDAFTLMYHQARLLKTVGRVGDAQAAFESCISEKWAGSGSAQIRAYAHNEYGHLLSEQGSDGEAAEQYLRSIQVDPSFARGWVNLASARAGGGIDGQIEALEMAISLEPTLTEAWINKGQVSSTLNPKPPKTDVDRGLDQQGTGEELVTSARGRKTMRSFYPRTTGFWH